MTLAAIAKDLLIAAVIFMGVGTGIGVFLICIIGGMADDHESAIWERRGTSP